MKRNVARGNFLLIKIITGIFVVLLAIYIPLRIHIARSGKGWPEKAVADLEIYVTAGFGPRSGPRVRLEELEALIDPADEQRDERSFLLVDACGSGCCGKEDFRGGFFDEEVRKRIAGTGYDAIIPGPACPGQKEEDYFRKLVGYSGQTILLIPANLFEGSRPAGSLKKKAVMELTLADMAEGEPVDIKTGIFCVLFSDSIYRSYDRNKPFNLIDPRMAALETAASMKKKQVDLILAFCSASGGRSEALAAEVPGIDLVVNFTGDGGSAVRRVPGGALLVDLGNKSCLNRITVTITADSLSAVVNKTEKGG